MQQITLSPVFTVALNHRAYHVIGSQAWGTVVVASERDALSIISDRAQVIEISRSPAIRSVAVYLSRSLLACADSRSDGLAILDLDGDVLVESGAPEPEAGAGIRTAAEYKSLRFSADGRFLWCAASVASDRVEVEIRDCSTLQVIDRMLLEDEIGDSDLILGDGGNNHDVSLWFAGGQDGQAVYWLDRTASGLVHRRVRPLDDSSPPEFTPSRSRYVVASEGTISVFDADSEEILASFEAPFAEEDGFGGLLHLLDERRCLIGTDSGRLFLIDLETGRCLGEIVVAGHEPRPAEEVYHPGLQGDMQLCIRLRFTWCDDRLVAAFRHDGGRGSDGWRDTLLVMQANSPWPLC